LTVLNPPDDRLTLYANRQVQTTSSSGTNPGPTWSNETGIYIGGTSGGLSLKDNIIYGFYYFGYNIDDKWNALKAYLIKRYFTFTFSQLLPVGNSLTESYNLNDVDPTHTYPSQVITSLESLTGKTWVRPINGTIAEVGATLTRILQLIDTNVPYYIDDFAEHRIAVCGGGSNDFCS
jgi:hypothetical protein